MVAKFDLSKIVDELCQCGHKKSDHLGGFPIQGHGACTKDGCPCNKFRWVSFLDKDGNKI